MMDIAILHALGCWLGSTSKVGSNWTKMGPTSEGRSHLEGGAHLTPHMIEDCYIMMCPSRVQ